MIIEVQCTVCRNLYYLEKEPKNVADWTCTSCRKGHWTLEEVAYLKLAVDAGTMQQDIAHKLGRPVLAIRRKIGYLGLDVPAVAPKTEQIICCVCGSKHMVSKHYAKYYIKSDEYVCKSCGMGSSTIGETRKTCEGYLEVKLAERAWQRKHILIWLIYNGPIPPGHFIDFKDGNKENVARNNLILKPLVDLFNSKEKEDNRGKTK